MEAVTSHGGHIALMTYVCDMGVCRQSSGRHANWATDDWATNQLGNIQLGKKIMISKSNTVPHPKFCRTVVKFFFSPIWLLWLKLRCTVFGWKFVVKIWYWLLCYGTFWQNVLLRIFFFIFCRVSVAFIVCWCTFCPFSILSKLSAQLVCCPDDHTAIWVQFCDSGHLYKNGYLTTNKPKTKCNTNPYPIQVYLLRSHRSDLILSWYVMFHMFMNSYGCAFCFCWSCLMFFLYHGVCVVCIWHVI